MGARSYRDVPRVYIDMDGVIADYEFGATQMKMHPNQYKMIAGAFRNLPMISGVRFALEFFNRCGYDVFFMTKIPSRNPYAATEKLLWIHEHLPDYRDKVIITSDKGAVGIERDFLIDDHPEWANCANFRGTVIKFVYDGPGAWRRTIEENFIEDPAHNQVYTELVEDLEDRFL